MKILIVEDETAAYESLVEVLKEIDPEIEVLGNTESVNQTINWLKEQPLPDLILMDIHLSDGSAFLIFEHIEVEVPIIFTTAYDEYAIEAFKVNSIDYLLKPIKTIELERALQKFTKLSRTGIADYVAKVNHLAPTPRYQNKLLIPANFFRANKQFIIARNAVKNITVWFDSRLLVTLDRAVPERIYISKNKAAEFKEWLVNE
ncbi:DNA-binding response regulator [Pedobacter sp. PLR]|uniref:LytR/AlgR family response regulator transcription factor n=1 Tax=Pedobacter sp. PLR TaxID=2994465 RepID=UPI0022473511|nr:DNA-binding response regulator [Pedobacter sp. PLR]MCX2452290.1 DNA-binding response regulator [Pedobacter sp. PLR]